MIQGKSNDAQSHGKIRDLAPPRLGFKGKRHQRRFELFKLTLNLLTHYSASQKECASVIGVNFRIRAITLNAKSLERLDGAAYEGSRIVADMQRALFERRHSRGQTPVSGDAS